MKNIYKNMDLHELLKFHRDCRQAACKCPQFSGGIDDVPILEGHKAKAEVVEYWANNRVLWDSGYSRHLSLRSRLVIQEYKVQVHKGLVRKLRQQIEQGGY